VLPIIEVEDEDEAIEFINARYARLTGLDKGVSDTSPVTILSRYTCFPLILQSSRKVIPVICSLVCV
jgi:hypothetical protein